MRWKINYYLSSSSSPVWPVRPCALHGHGRELALQGQGEGEEDHLRLPKHAHHLAGEAHRCCCETENIKHLSPPQSNWLSVSGTDRRTQWSGGLRTSILVTVRQKNYLVF